MKTLVTGAAGFLGAHVARVLLEAGHEVRALHLPGDDLRNLDALRLGGLDVERVAGDVTDAAGMRAAARGRDRVFHLAAVYALGGRAAAQIERVNVHGTRTVLEAARAEGVGRVVHTSSIACFGGQGPGRRGDETARFALGRTGDRYALSKALSHRVAVGAARAGQDVTIVAPVGPIGPGDVRPTPTGQILLSALDGPAAVVVDSTVCLGDARDLARGHLLAAERGKAGEAYLLGGHDVTYAELARLARRLAGLAPRALSIPYALAGLLARAEQWAARRADRPPVLTPGAVAISRLGLAADCSRARRELGLEVRPLERSVEDALRWFARGGYLRRELPGLDEGALRTHGAGTG